MMSDKSEESERASRLARADGIEQIGFLVSTTASAKLFHALGYYGSYGFSQGFITLSFLYMMFFVR